ncbi:hypothetical protein [Roseofilum casamattae]|uniref:Uncharacterized protein n=1 Tax=Roseofilum casamattae BLCC-M143 TaxID=3022442 RepID=A0ABT7BYH3_9CYAN|nr:hypothetical protein [Roseofilum casamattae]MDJ1183501.1 hypothetical protein [Roseofilum casamattae BLCC-M143]
MDILLVLGAIGYGIGAWKFWKGYHRTNFAPGLINQALFSAGWPLLLFNRSFRQNFKKALKGR